MGALIILLSTLAYTMWNINSTSTSTKVVQLTESGSVHSSAKKEDQVELSDSFLKHMEPLMKMFEDRLTLLAESVRMNASAPQTSKILSSSNSYVSLNIAQVNTYQDLLSIKAKINAPLFVKDFADRACPMSPSMLSASGSILTDALPRELLIHYFVQSSPTTSPLHFIVRSSPFGSISEVSKDMYLEGTFSLTNVQSGSYTITAIPGCMSIGGTSELYTNATIQDTFEKKSEPLEIYGEESNTDSLLRILTPSIDPKVAGKAIRTIPYTVSNQGKAFSEVLSIPYIQTDSTLVVKAESTLPQGMLSSSGTLLQEKKYYTQFSLYNKENTLVATTESQKVLSPLKSVKTTWYGSFSSIPKGEYTLITRLILESTDADNTTQEIVKRSRVKNIGIGDIYMAIGDSTLTGYDGETWGEDIGQDMLQGRSKAQPSKECEIALFNKTTCRDESRLYYGMTASLAEQLTERKGYPVLILSEGLPENATLDKLVQYLHTSKTPLKERYNLLSPTALLLQVSSHTLPGKAKDNLEEMRKIFTGFKEGLTQFRGGKDIPVYYALPQYEENNPTSETFALEFKQYMSQETGFIPGPNLYKLFFEKLLSEKSANLYRQSSEEHVYVNDLGLKEVAAAWANYIN